MHKTDNAAVSNENNEVFTYIAIPLEVFQACSDQNAQPLTVTQNVILKTLSDGKMCIIDTNHFLKSQNVSEVAQHNDESVIIEANDIKNNNNSENQNNKVLDTVLIKSQFKDKNDPKKVHFSYMKCKVAHLLKSNEVSKEKDLKCPVCSEKFEKMVQYKKHMEEHRNMKKYKCEQCSASYNVYDNFKLHSAMHVRGEPTCPMCNRKFQRLASLKAHLMLHEVDETYTCLDCTEEFEKEEDLKKHVEVHQQKEFEEKNDKLPLICSYCNYLFEDANDYKKHITHHMKIRKLVLNGKRRKQSSNKEHTHKCNVCDKSFPKYSLLERHLRIHSGEKPFVCNYCDRGFSQKGTLQLHMSLHTGVKRFKCTLCPAKFNQKGNLRAHVERTHMAPVPGEKIYKCTMCTCIFKKVASLNGHITKVHSCETASSDITSVMENLKQLENQIKPSAQLNNRPKLKSVAKFKKKVDINEVTDMTDVVEVNTDIDYNYTYVKLADSSIDGSIRRYVVKQRKAGDMRWYICSYCGKEFKKPSDLIRHIRVHTQERPFKCKQCGLGFSLKSTLASHLNTHVGKREYKCIICLKMFTSIRTLNVHLARHNRTVTNQHYKCNTCHVTFSSSTKAKLHTCSNKKVETDQNEIQIVMKQPMVLTANGLLPVAAPKPKIPYGELEQYKLRPHRCSICNAAFTKPLHVKRHMLMHTGEKKFKCDLCDKAFYTSYALKQHTNFHNGIKNFVCKVCNKRFVTNALLKRHLLMHSSQKPYFCPYCDKHFKTVMLCRKHINIHKRDLKMQIQALNETGEIVNLEEADKAELANTDQGTSDIVILPQENSMALVESSNVSVPVENQPPAVQEITVNLKESVLDKNNVFLWQKNAEDNVPGILNVLNEQQLYQIPIDNSTMDLIVRNLGQDTENVTEHSDLQPTIFINAGDLESNVPLYIQNETVLMNDLNNVYPIDTINSTMAFGNETHNFETITQNLIFNPDAVNVDLEKNVIGENLLPSINEINNKSVKLSSFVNTSVQNIATNLNDGFVDLGQDSVIKNSHVNNLSLALNFNDAINNEIEVPNNSSTSATYLHGSTEITCTTCHKSFTSLQKLHLHKCCLPSQSGQIKRKKKQNEKHNDTVFTCLQCNKAFSNNTFYLRHMNLHRNKKVENLHKCTYCEKSFKKPSDLVRHIRTHTGEKPFNCDKCDKSFSLKSTLESHYRTHNPGGNKEYNCQVCNSYFSSKASLKVHMLLHTGVKPYQCNLCPAKFRTAAHRKLHENWHAKTDKNKKSQSKNSKVSNLIASVMQDTNLYQSVQEIQLGLEKEHVSATVVSDENQMLENVDLTQAIQIDPVLLHHLQSNNLLLQESELLNTNLIAIDSKVQNESYVNVENNTEGQMEILKEPKQKNFQCDICHKTYISKSVLTKHRKVHGYKFKCSSCNKGFQTNEELEKHQKLHSGYRPFSCHLCTNSFSEEGSLKTHMKRIHQNTNLDSPIDINIQDNFIC